MSLDDFAKPKLKPKTKNPIADEPWLTTSQFSKECNIAQSSIYKAIEAGKIDLLAKNKINLDSENTRAYAASKGFNIEKFRGKIKQEPDTSEKLAGQYGLPDKIPSRLDLEYIEQYHKTRKLIVDNAKKSGELIARSIVERMISVVDIAMSQIIMDGASTLVSEIYAKAKAGESLGEVQLYYRNEVHKYLDPIKPSMQRLLKTAKKITDSELPDMADD